MNACRLIVCEKSSHWAAAVRLSLAGRPPAVVETRGLAQAAAALAASPASLVAIETTSAQIDAVLAFLERSRQQYAQAQFLGLWAGPDAAAAQLLREAGAIDVLTSVLAAGRCARLARRQFALAPPAGPLTLPELIAERLPWSAYATSVPSHPPSTP
jgi:hypothetical protein